MERRSQETLTAPSSSYYLSVGMAVDNAASNFQLLVMVLVLV